jgi:DNA-binding CsgD family transcriptional regulator
VARVRARSGRWVVLHGAVMATGNARRIAVIVEPARGVRVSTLLMSAYGLTEREREVTRAVLQGASTAEIAEQLVVSAHTVQQHLKSIFDKTGVRSRRELVGKVFFRHYEPRLRDNERRAADHRPARGRSTAASRPAARTLTDASSTRENPTGQPSMGPRRGEGGSVAARARRGFLGLTAPPLTYWRCSPRLRLIGRHGRRSAR